MSRWEQPDLRHMVTTWLVNRGGPRAAFSTIISWNYFGKVNFEHLFGKKALVIYSAVAVAFVFFGSVLSNDLVWALTDMFNNLMVIPNVIALVALGGLVKSLTKFKKQDIPEIK